MEWLFGYRLPSEITFNNPGVMQIINSEEDPTPVTNENRNLWLCFVELLERCHHPQNMEDYADPFRSILSPDGQDLGPREKLYVMLLSTMLEVHCKNTLANQ